MRARVRDVITNIFDQASVPLPRQEVKESGGTPNENDPFRVNRISWNGTSYHSQLPVVGEMEPFFS